MIVTILDLETGETATTEDQTTPYQWAEGNWSCDCNRARYFGDAVDEEMDRRMREEHPDLLPHQSYCYGAKRFLVVSPLVFEDENNVYTIEEVNGDYPKELCTLLKWALQETR